MEFTELSKEYAAALKQVQSTKPKEGYLVFQLGYENKLVIPHKDGVVLLNSLNLAEQFEEAYNKVPEIKAFDRTKISISRMSCEEYDHIKVAALLGLTLTEVTEASRAAFTKPTPPT